MKKKVNQKRIKDINKVMPGDDELEVKRFLIILGVLIVLIVGVYFVTELLSKEEAPESEVVSGSINYDLVNVGGILNRPYKDYYVMVYDSTSSEAVIYSTLINKYMSNSSKDGYIKLYFCDLDNALNKDFYNKNEDGKSNKNVEKTSDFNFSNLTLLKVNNGKVTKYIENYSEIEKLLEIES